MEKQIVDDQFGLLTFLEDLDSNYFWCGKAMFNNQNIDIHIPILDKYPAGSQKNWFKEIHSSYKIWLPKIFKILPDKLKAEYNFIDFYHFEKHFIPKAILIPKLDKGDSDWSITFQSLDNKKHFLCVNFEDTIPVKAFLEK